MTQCAGIIGRNGDGTGQGSSTSQNNYYLNTKSSVAFYNYVENDDYSANTENGKTETQMKDKNFVSSLGDAYAEDTQNINNGYPILKWQKENNYPQV